MNISQGAETRRSILDKYRELWRAHVLWTKSYITSLITGFGNLAYYNDRMYDNIEAFETELAKHYDNDDTKSYGLLMRNHILSKLKFLIDYQKGDMAAAGTDRAEWQKNAVLWAERLAQMNPYWDRQVWESLLLEHIQLTEGAIINEVTYRIPDPEATAMIEEQIAQLADYMANGIIQQFGL